MTRVVIIVKQTVTLINEWWILLTNRWKEWPEESQGDWTSGKQRRDTWQEARKQNADSLQVQEASSQRIGGHGQEAHWLLQSPRQTYIIGIHHRSRGCLMGEKEQLLLMNVTKKDTEELLLLACSRLLWFPGLARGCLVAVLAIGLRLGGTVESDSNPGTLKLII
jgi:hypothetical protein